MEKQVRWVKRAVDNGGNTVQVNEGSGWVSYRRSHLYTPDNWMSSGYPTFLRCIQAGYKVTETITLDM